MISTIDLVSGAPTLEERLSPPAVDRAEELFLEGRDRTFRKADRVFFWLLLGQWVLALALALIVSPYAWAGKNYTLHLHVYVALFVGGLINAAPITLILTRKGAFETRLTVACAQMLWSALLIHLTGGRIETHFHVFGSLAIVAFYRDVKVLIPATIVVASDHFFRGMYWPDSVYGLSNPEWWRFLEHAAWVVFIDIFLVLHCLQGVAELREVSSRQAEVEALSASERLKSKALDRALGELQNSQEALVRTEKLAAVGQLAASVGHELRNPLAAVRNASTYIGKKIDASKSNGAALSQDTRVNQFRGVIDRELDACSKIISDLLDFARTRQPQRRPCPLYELVEESIEIVPKRSGVAIVNSVPTDLPVPEIDKDQFRQVFVNLVQNASEAMADGQNGRVEVIAHMDGDDWKIQVKDDGPGMPADVAAKIFQPLYSTKTKGTGLGLAIVSSSLERHGARIRVETQPGAGTTFIIDVPAHAGGKDAE
jgi:two-component system sensor histidine kinase HydH